MSRRKPNKSPTGKSEATPLRALTVFTSLPPDHKTFRVTDDASAPHLQAREFAVVDMTDRELQHGELYLQQSQGGERRRSIVQIKTDYLTIRKNCAAERVWWICCLRGFHRTSETTLDGIPVFHGMSDGPYVAESLQPTLIGRVVGVASSPLGQLLDPAAGWENEKAGNEAFDAKEYLDVLVATGHRPYVMHGRGGKLIYGEMMPEACLTAAGNKLVNQAREKFCEASTAIERVKAECLRRGMVDG